MNTYKEQIGKVPIEKLGGRVNKLFLYELDNGEKVVHMQRAVPFGHPMDVASAPRLAGVPRERIWWMTYEQQRDHSFKLNTLGIRNVPFLEIGEDYAIRKYQEGRTLREKLENDEFSKVREWLEKIVIAQNAGVPLADRITANTIVDDAGNIHFMDFDIGSDEKGFVVAQAAFYACWLSAGAPEVLAATRKTAESLPFDYSKFERYFMAYLNNVIRPEEGVSEMEGGKITKGTDSSILYRIECHPSIDSPEKKRELRLKLRDFAKNTLF
ncbi:MAG: hypothetical protein ABIH51_00920 [Patescibacteria group bacterium]